MLYPTTARGQLGHFPLGSDPTATDHCYPPTPIGSLISSSLRVISSDGDGGRGVWGGASGCRSPRDSGGGGGRTGGKTRDGEGATSNTIGAAKKMTTATTVAESRACG